MGSFCGHNSNEKTKQEIKDLINEAQSYYLNRQVRQGLEKIEHGFYRLSSINNEGEKMSGNSLSFT